MLPFWDDLTPNQKGILTAGSSEFHYDKDTNVHSAESECIGMLLVTSGSLRVYMLSEEGREITLYRIHAGDSCVLSAACVLKSITFDVFIDTVEAVSYTHLDVYKRQDDYNMDTSSWYRPFSI